MDEIESGVDAALQAPASGRGARGAREACLGLALSGLALGLPGSAFGWSAAPGLEDVQLAYIDPGAGSFMIQALVAALAGVAVTLRMYWDKIKVMLGMATADEDDEDSVDGDE